jgi:tetratricopeptide (TPR) repeat protein
LGERDRRRPRRLASLDAPDAWSDLLAAHLLISDEERLTLLAHPELRPYLLTLITLTERYAWHNAAEHYQDHGDYLEAALHFRQAAAPEKAARILIEHAAWFQTQHRARLGDLLRGFRPAEVAPNTWAQLKLIGGNVAEALQDTDTALAEYGQALTAEDIAIKAEAHYRRARIFKLRNPAEALAHYEACLRLLETAHSEHPLLVQAALDAAWVYMEDHRDLAQAERRLQQAQAHPGATDCRLAARLRNAWGEWWYLRGDLARSLAELHQARLAALEAPDVEMQLNAAYDLGIRYAESGKLTEALGYLQEGRTLAIQVSDRQREGRCDKGIGEYYFWLRDYGEAVRCYEAAYTIFKAMNNPTRQATACYDLAEALAELADWETAHCYFHEGVALAETMTGDNFRGDFQALVARYPRLIAQSAAGDGGDPITARIAAVPGGKRQTQILAHLQAQAALTSQSCAQLLGLSKEQTLRELRALRAQGLVTTHGKGPATRYALP